MKEKKNRLDEMQEQKMLRIEHNGCWLAFWGLFVITIGQLIFYGPEKRELFIGEGSIFVCLALYIAGACVKNGIWDRRLQPSSKVNLCASAIGGIAGGAIRLFAVYFQYGNLPGALATGCIISVIIFAVCFLILSLGLFIYRKKTEQLELEGEPESRIDNRHKSEK